MLQVHIKTGKAGRPRISQEVRNLIQYLLTIYSVKGVQKNLYIHLGRNQDDPACKISRRTIERIASESKSTEGYTKKKSASIKKSEIAIGRNNKKISNKITGIKLLEHMTYKQAAKKINVSVSTLLRFKRLIKSGKIKI